MLGSKPGKFVAGKLQEGAQQLKKPAAGPLMIKPPLLRSLYRALLRELPPRPILASPRTNMHHHIRRDFEQPRTSQRDESARKAWEYLKYLKSQRQYAALLDRYNPGMGMDEEERVRLSARRVGMDLPAEYDGVVPEVDEEDGGKLR